jgi:hypothetical protein
MPRGLSLSYSCMIFNLTSYIITQAHSSLFRFKMATGTITKSQTLLQQSEDFSFPTIPPFPNDIPTAPLVRLSLASLRSSPEEADRFFNASKELGFFYLDLRNDPLGEGLLSRSSQFFDLAPTFFDLGREELSRYDYKHLGSYMGYKGFGSAVVDEKGNLDRNEFYNVRPF